MVEGGELRCSQAHRRGIDDYESSLRVPYRCACAGRSACPHRPPIGTMGGSIKDMGDRRVCPFRPRCRSRTIAADWYFGIVPALCMIGDSPDRSRKSASRRSAIMDSERSVDGHQFVGTVPRLVQHVFSTLATFGAGFDDDFGRWSSHGRYHGKALDVRHESTLRPRQRAASTVDEQHYNVTPKPDTSSVGRTTGMINLLYDLSGQRPLQALYRRRCRCSWRS